jgi:hypothetical protein
MKIAPILIVPMLMVSAFFMGCDDPYKDNLIEELGEEQSGFSPSEIHRPGQPCLACHSEYQGDEPLMTFGGTLFAEPVSGVDLVLVAGFIVRLIDTRGKTIDVKTNKCGNFFLTQDQFEPEYPVRAEIFGPQSPGSDSIVQLRTMSSRISRDGSCGTCHIHPASPYSPGVAYVPSTYLTPGMTAPQGCPTPSFSDPL